MIRDQGPAIRKLGSRDEDAEDRGFLNSRWPVARRKFKTRTLNTERCGTLRKRTPKRPAWEAAATQVDPGAPGGSPAPTVPQTGMT
jgi:hypothetical protein